MSIEVRSHDGLSLAVDRVGEGEPIVLVHGLGFSRKRWQGSVDALSDAGYCVISYDMRGFGDSQLPEADYGMDDLCADLTTIADTLELDRFHLVGHSLGGMYSQLYTLAHPRRVRSLTLVSTTSHSGERGSAFGAALSYLAKHGYDKAMENETFRNKVEMAIAFLSDPSVRSQLDGTLSHELPTGDELLALIRRMTPEANPARSYAWRCTVGFSTRKRLHELNCPTFVLHGTRDMIIPYVAGQLLNEGLDGARWQSFEGAGHSLPMEREPEFSAALVDFVGSVDR